MFFLKKAGPVKLNVQSGYDLWAATYAVEMNPIKSASDEVISKMLPPLTGKRVVDVGCGSGHFCAYAEKGGAKEIVGIDFSSKMVEQAKRICKYTKFQVNDIRNIELEERSADVIICALVLGHLEKIDLVISIFSKTLVKEGMLIISDFHPFLSLKGQQRTFRKGKEVFEVPHYTHLLGEYINSLTQAGLSVVQMEEPVWNGNPMIFVLKIKKT